MFKLATLVALLPLFAAISGEPSKLHRKCHGPMGMQSRAIKDNQISASTIFDVNHAAKYGRLGMVKKGAHMGAWSAKFNNKNQYLQVDLKQVSMVTGIATQGRSDSNQWVKTYKVEYSQDGRKWEFVLGTNGRPRIFAGNRNRNTVIKNKFDFFKLARYVRIRPMSWQGHVSMRVELYGCPRKNGIKVTCTNTYLQVDISKELLHGLNPHELRLIDPRCKGTQVVLNGKRHYRLKTKLTKCGTEKYFTKHYIHYANKVTVTPLRRGQRITRIRMIEIPAICSYEIDRAQTARSLQPDQSTAVMSEHSGGVIPVSLNMFPNGHYRNAQKIMRNGGPIKVKLRQELFYKIRIYIDDLRLWMRTVHCFATPTRSFSSKPRHDIIQNACPVDPTVRMYGEKPRVHQHYQKFSFRAFRLLPSYKYVFLHCKVKVCDGKKGICAKRCAAKGKRDLIAQDESVRTMIVSHPEPLEIEDEEEQLTNAKPAEDAGEGETPMAEEEQDQAAEEQDETAEKQDEGNATSEDQA